MEFLINDCNYEMRSANFQKALAQAYKLTSLLKGAFVDNQLDIGALLCNLDTKEVQEVSKFILSHTVVTDEENKKHLLQNEKEADAFFNFHRDHYFKVLFEGVKFHFLPFLPSGIASSLNTLSLENLQSSVM